MAVEPPPVMISSLRALGWRFGGLFSGSMRVEEARTRCLRFALLGSSVLVILLGTGCVHRPPSQTRPFRLGLYGIHTNQMALVREVGFDLVRGPAERGFLDAAQSHGLGVLAEPGDSAGPKLRPEVVRSTVRRFDRHPALWSWYLSDEPDLNGIPVEEVKRVQREVRRAGGTKPTSLVVFEGPSLSEYHQTDILMVDRYPIGWHPLAAYFQHLRHGGVAAGVGKRRLYGVVQAFDWSYYRDILDVIPGSPLGPPTRDELRCMVYGSWILGVEGLFFYAYDDGRWKMSEHPEVWTGLSDVVREVRARTSLFEGRFVPSRLRVRCHDRRREFNEALEGSLLYGVFEVPTGGGGIGAGHYLAVVNTTPEELWIRLEGQGVPRGSIPVLGENRTVLVEPGRPIDRLPPHGVTVYGPFAPIHP